MLFFREKKGRPKHIITGSDMAPLHRIPPRRASISEKSGATKAIDTCKWESILVL